MNDAAAVEQETRTDLDSAWFLPTGAARGTRNAHRLRGWAIAITAAIVFWGIIAVVVAALAGWF